MEPKELKTIWERPDGFSIVLEDGVDIFQGCMVVKDGAMRCLPRSFDACQKWIAEHDRELDLRARTPKGPKKPTIPDDYGVW